MKAKNVMRWQQRGANDGLWDWNLRTNLIYFSPRWKFMLGREEAEIGSSPEDWFRHVHPEDIEPLKEAIALHLQGCDFAF